MRCLVLLLGLQVLACLASAQSTGLVPIESEGHPDASIPLQAAPEKVGKKDPMSELLHWAIEHSDPETLKNLMEEYKEKNLTIKDIYGQEVIDAFFKTEGDVISQQIAVIQDFRNASLPDSTLEAALEELEELLHQVDHAGNLNRMGGMKPLLEMALGEEREETIRSLALWVLGVAVQNNAQVQEELHGLGGLKSLAERLQQCGGDAAGAQYCGKLLFCLSGLLKNSAMLQAIADQHGVMQWMMEVGIKHPAPGVVKKALGFLDTIFAQSPQLPFLETLAETRDAMAASVLRLVESPDADTSEKAIALMGRLAELRPKLFSSFREDLLVAARKAQHQCEANGGDKDLCSELLHSAAEVDRKLVAATSFQEL